MLEQVWTQHQDLFRRIASSILLDPTLIDDVLQETYVRLLRNGRDFADEPEAFNYVRRALINTSFDFYRRVTRYGHRFESSDELAALPGAVSEALDPLNRVVEQEAVRRRQRLLTSVRRAVRRLPRAQRDAIKLVFEVSPDLPIKEVCRRHQIPYSTLRSRLRRAFRLIRAELHNEFERVPAGEECHEL